MGNATIRIARKFPLQAIEEEHPIRAFVLCFDGSTRFQFEQCLYVSGNSFRNVDLAGGQCASINDAVFTASPQMSKLKRRLPTTPEMTCPVWMPTTFSTPATAFSPFATLYGPPLPAFPAPRDRRRLDAGDRWRAHRQQPYRHPQLSLASLRPVEIYREFITAAARWMMAAKL